MGLVFIISQIFVCCPVISAQGRNEWVWYLLYLRCLRVVLSSQQKLQMNGFGNYYILDVCVLPCFLSPSQKSMDLASVISQMFVCSPVISAQGRNEWVGICYISDVCVLSCYLSQGTIEWVCHLLYLRCLCVVLSSQPKVQMNGFGIYYILNICVLSCYLSQSYK